MPPGTRQMANRVTYMLIMDRYDPTLPTLRSQFGRHLQELVRLHADIHFEAFAVPATGCLNEPFKNALPARRSSGANTKGIRGVLGTLNGGGGGGSAPPHISLKHIFQSVSFHGFGQSTIETK